MCRLNIELAKEYYDHTVVAFDQAAVVLIGRNIPISEIIIDKTIIYKEDVFKGLERDTMLVSILLDADSEEVKQLKSA